MVIRVCPELKATKDLEASWVFKVGKVPKVLRALTVPMADQESLAPEAIRVAKAASGFKADLDLLEVLANPATLDRLVWTVDIISCTGLLMLATARR